MEIVVIPNDTRREGWKMSCPYTIGDIVRLNGKAFIFSCYKNAFKMLWDGEFDSFHDDWGNKETQFYDGTLQLWKIQNFAVHAVYRHIIMCHLKDMTGRNLLVDINSLLLVKKGPRHDKDNLMTVRQVPF